MNITSSSANTNNTPLDMTGLIVGLTIGLLTSSPCHIFTIVRLCRYIRRRWTKKIEITIPVQLSDFHSYEGVTLVGNRKLRKDDAVPFLNSTDSAINVDDTTESSSITENHDLSEHYQLLTYECEQYEERPIAFRREQFLNEKLLTAPPKRSIEAVEAGQIENCTKQAVDDTTTEKEPVQKENGVMTAEEGYQDSHELCLPHDIPETDQPRINWNKVFNYLARNIIRPSDFPEFFSELFTVENPWIIIEEINLTNKPVRQKIVQLFHQWKQTAGSKNLEVSIQEAFRSLEWNADLDKFNQYMRHPPLLEGQNIEMLGCPENFPGCICGYSLPLPKNSNDRKTEYFDTRLECSVNQSVAKSELLEERLIERVIKYSGFSRPRKRKSFQEDTLPIAHSRNKYRKFPTSKHPCSKTKNTRRQNINSRLAKHIPQSRNQTSVKGTKRVIKKIERNEQQPSEECDKMKIWKVKRNSSPMINQGVVNERERDTTTTSERCPINFSGTCRNKKIASVVSSGCFSEDSGISSSGVHYPYSYSSVSSESSSTFHSDQNLADIEVCRSTQSWTVNPNVDFKRLFKRGSKTTFKQRQKLKDKESTSFRIPSKHRKNRRKCRGKCQPKYALSTFHFIKELMRYNPNLSPTSYEIFLDTLLKQLTKPYQPRKLILKVKMDDLKKTVEGFFLSFDNRVIVFNKTEWDAVQLYLKARPKSEEDKLFVTRTGDPVTEI